MEKFKPVARTYTRQFGYVLYYGAFISLLEKYCAMVTTVLEVGGADGIIPERWDAVRQASQVGNLLQYHSVEPVAEAVAIAREKAMHLVTLDYRSHVGTLKNALTICNLQRIDAVVMSRVLHEVFLDYGRNAERLGEEIRKLLAQSRPRIVIYGDAEPVYGLGQEKTQRFIDAQTRVIGHGHDPAMDYPPFRWIIECMANEGYGLQEERHLAQPLEGFAQSPWRFVIGVFVR